MVYERIDFTPPKGVRSEAAKGLAWRREFGRGGTEVGIARARDLSNGTTISPDTARRMKAYFDRHQSDKQGQGWNPGEEGFPSNGRIAWALWGSDAGWAWSRKLVEQMESADQGEGRTDAILEDEGHDDAVLDMAERVLRAFDESKHPRAEDGKFGSGGGGGGGSKPAPNSKESAARVKETHEALKSAIKAKKAVKWSLDRTKKKEAAKAVSKAFNDHLDAVATHKGWGSTYDRSQSMNVERRSLINANVSFPAIKIESRAEDVLVDGQQQTVRRDWCVGYASVFGMLSLDLRDAAGDFVERIDPRAFDRVLSRSAPQRVETRALWNHDANFPLARYPKTLNLIVDERGLRYEFPFPRSSYGQDLRMNIEDDIVKGSSFGFVTAPGGDRWSVEDGRSVRTVMDIDALYDVSPTTFPAYPESDVAVAKRSYDQFLKAGGSKRSENRPSPLAEYREFLAQHGRKLG